MAVTELFEQLPEIPDDDRKAITTILSLGEYRRLRHVAYQEDKGSVSNLIRAFVRRGLADLQAD